jgi:hypothetical protein
LPQPSRKIQNFEKEIMANIPASDPLGALGAAAAKRAANTGVRPGDSAPQSNAAPNGNGNVNGEDATYNA